MGRKSTTPTSSKMVDRGRSASRSVSPGGEIQQKGERSCGVSVSDESGEPIGFLEYWSHDCWIYTDVETLEETER